MPFYVVETHGQLEPFLQREWLLTNGLGGFAASTLVGCNTRRYHGLFIAATLPPVGRIMALNRIGEIVTLDRDHKHHHELAVNHFKHDIHPRGDRYLRRFHLDDVARWEYDVADVQIFKELQLPWMRNVAAIRYRVEAPPQRHVELKLFPFVSLRDFHATMHATAHPMPFETYDHTVAVTHGQHTLHIHCDETARFHAHPRWWYGHVYPIETERGLEDTEDLFNPGHLTVVFTGSGTVTLWCALERMPHYDWDAELTRRREAIETATHVPENIQAASQATGDEEIRIMPERTRSRTLIRLARAAKDFVVYRKAPDGQPGTSILAGYPWFADWGRDTMIALPGLLLVTRRFNQARQVLRVFAEYVSEGMIPNRFDDYTNEPHYNTVDASLWFIHACFEYLRLSGDANTFQTLLHPACRAILDGYKRGTRFNIRMDQRDSLIFQGDEHTQLTWMDAKCDGVSFTPRHGKPVEINALWYNALVLMEQHELAEKVEQSFRRAFWISPFRGLADVVINGESRDGYVRDLSLRPNQIFAASLTHSPLNPEERHAVVEVVRRELLTPFGLRSLAKSDPKYHGRYLGSRMQRDAAYHNGPVWPWLIGPFLDAYLKAHDRSPESIAQARQWLSPLISELEGPSIGQLHELYEGDPPHRAVGCFAQAWTVAETLRLAALLEM